jgi:hypothetical protein
MGVLPCPYKIILESIVNDTLLLFWHYKGNRRVRNDSTIGSALATIVLEIPDIKVVLTRFDFGNCFGLNVATMSDTVFLALMHVALALDDFFSEPFEDS